MHARFNVIDNHTAHTNMALISNFDAWDSVGHMQLVAELEDAFDIMMDTDDIIDLSSYEKGKEILAKADYEVEF